MKSTSRLGWLALLAIIPGTLALLVLGALRPEAIATQWSAPLVSNAFVDAKLKYQIVTLGIALAVLAVTAALAPHKAIMRLLGCWYDRCYNPPANIRVRLR